MGKPPMEFFGRVLYPHPGNPQECYRHLATGSDVVRQLGCDRIAGSGKSFSDRVSVGSKLSHYRALTALDTLSTI
jgi:hypothetical protein